MEYIGRLGSGSFGVAELLFDSKNDIHTVYKFIDKDIDITDEVLNHNYVSNHENIISLKSFGNYEKYNFIELEYAENGDLFHYIKKNGKQTELYSKYLIWNILNGIEYCHKNNIIHYDIKLENILLDKNNTPKLADFGYSKYSSYHKKRVGTLQYMPPEVLKCESKDLTKIDIYACGVCLYVMLHNTYPFKGKNNMEIGANILRNKYKINNIDLSKNCVDLIQKILEPNENKRLTIQEIRNHPWLKY